MDLIVYKFDARFNCEMAIVSDLSEAERYMEFFHFS